MKCIIDNKEYDTCPCEKCKEINMIKDNDKEVSVEDTKQFMINTLLFMGYIGFIIALIWFVAG